MKVILETEVISMQAFYLQTAGFHSDFEGEVWAKLGEDLQDWKSRSSSGLGHCMQDFGRTAGRSRQAQQWDGAGQDCGPWAGVAGACTEWFQAVIRSFSSCSKVNLGNSFNAEVELFIIFKGIGGELK